MTAQASPTSLRLRFGSGSLAAPANFFYLASSRLAHEVRVLRPGGRLILTVPFAWDEHEQPHDFARYSSFGLRALLERCGFRVLEQRKSRCGLAAVCQLWIAVLYKSIPVPNRWLHLAVHAALALPLTLAGLLLGRVFTSRGDFYLDNVVLAERVGEVRSAGGAA